MAQYDKHAEEYYSKRQEAKKFDFNRDLEVPAMIKMVGDVKGKTLLDLGCGFGDHAEKLSKKGAKKIIGLDASKKLIELANKQSLKNCEFKVFDLNKKLPFKDNSFDVVYSSLTLHYIKNIDQLFLEVKRVLKKDGVFVFSVLSYIGNYAYSVPPYKIMREKTRNGQVIYGNYFDEKLKEADLGFTHVNLYTRNVQTWIKTSLNSGFELIDYCDPKPISSSNKYEKDKFELASKLPPFMFIKLRKN